MIAPAGPRRLQGLLELPQRRGESSSRLAGNPKTTDEGLEGHLRRPRSLRFCTETPRSRRIRCPLLMHLDLPALHRRRGIAVVRLSHLVVVEDRAARHLPDLDPEAVHTAAVRLVAVNSGEKERVPRSAVHRALALELSLRAGHRVPLVDRAEELETGPPVTEPEVG